MAEGLLFEEGLFVLLVPDVLLHDILFYTLRLLGVFLVLQVLGEIQHAHTHIRRAIEYQVALVDLDSCQIIVEDIGPSKCWAGDEAPEFVLLMQAHQLHINPLPQVFRGLPEDRVVHQLV